ncbi:MAG: hypothetical protein DRQ48_00955 [Gammaproteobacteria bacterium]|nr:MAG: hypothetical protein DRQ44_00415 [Gammaproteobacteria bacterium]RKZ72248.1 MAG: hypothetical protein DRQ48_00955 [Gammaproteobacteria bacterium]
MKASELDTVRMVDDRIQSLERQIKGFENINDKDVIYIAGYLDALNHLKHDLGFLKVSAVVGGGSDTPCNESGGSGATSKYGVKIRYTDESE